MFDVGDTYKNILMTDALYLPTVEFRWFVLSYDLIKSVRMSHFVVKVF
jgi:hypothetical protein